MANKHETLTGLFSNMADSIRTISPITEDIVADDFPFYIAASQYESSATPSIYSTCTSDTFKDWVIDNGYVTKWNDLTFLENDPTTGFTWSNNRIPGVVYSDLSNCYFSISVHATNNYGTVVSMNKDDLSYIDIKATNWGTSYYISKTPSCIEYLAGYVYVFFNGNTRDNGKEFSFLHFPTSSSAVSGVSNAVTGTLTNSYVYQISGVAKTSSGNMIAYSNYNNDTLSGSAKIYAIPTSTNQTVSISDAGLGSMSNHSPYVSATQYIGFPIGLTKKTRLTSPSSTSYFSNYGSYVYKDISSSEEGIKVYTVDDKLVICTKTTSDTYKLYYTSFTSISQISTATYSSVTISKPPVAIIPKGSFLLFFYEDGTMSVRTSINGSDIFTRSITSHTTVSIREVKILNDKLIITGWYGTDLVNSFISYYTI